MSNKKNKKKSKEEQLSDLEIELSKTEIKYHQLVGAISILKKIIDDERD